MQTFLFDTRTSIAILQKAVAATHINLALMLQIITFPLFRSLL